MPAGAEFVRTLREAQAGDESAFVRLWRDANPMVTRYLRVASSDEPSDAACECWATVIRGLPTFTGNEAAWRRWLLSSARLRATEGNLRQAWGTSAPRNGQASARRRSTGPSTRGVESARHRGVNDTISAIRNLPLGQGEVLMLRLVGGLSVERVAQLMGAEVTAVQRAERRALERLATDPELLAWSLAAPPLAEELTDERVVRAAFRAQLQPRQGAHGGTRVIAVRASRDYGLATLARSRVALWCIALVSASAMSVGGLSAAAYVGGVLPAGLQRVLHDVIGAPEPTVSGPAGSGRSNAPAPGGAPGTSGAPGTQGTQGSKPGAGNHGAGAGGPDAGRNGPPTHPSGSKSGVHPTHPTAPTHPSTPTHPTPPTHPSTPTHPSQGQPTPGGSVSKTAKPVGTAKTPTTGNPGMSADSNPSATHGHP